jgi:hypothetical protein
MTLDFDDLVADALSHPLVGWDFSWLADASRRSRYPGTTPGW